MALAVVALSAVSAVTGFYIGRYVLGEQYLKRGASRLKAQAIAYAPQPSAPASEAPLIEEPPPSESPQGEPSAAPRAPRRAGLYVDRKRGPPAPAGSQGVTLQLGSFLDPNNAKALVQDLRNRGYSPKVTAERQGESALHRVTIGPLSAEGARALAGDLRREGFEVATPGAP